MDDRRNATDFLGKLHLKRLAGVADTREASGWKSQITLVDRSYASELDSAQNACFGDTRSTGFLRWIGFELRQPDCHGHRAMAVAPLTSERQREARHRRRMVAIDLAGRSTI